MKYHSKPAIARKLLIVKRDPPNVGYNIMLEIGERSHCYQVPEEIGEVIIERCMDGMIDSLVQRGFKAEIKVKNGG